MIVLVAAAALVVLAATEASAQSARRNTSRCPQSGYLNGKWYCNVTKHTRGQTANGRKLVQPKSPTPMPPPAALRSRLVSQPAGHAKLAKPSPATPIPLPAAETPHSPAAAQLRDRRYSVDERQKLDYERQCYRHAEMIVRARLELLQSSIDKTISAVRSSEQSDP